MSYLVQLYLAPKVGGSVSDVVVEKELVIGKGGGRKLKVDVFRPARSIWSCSWSAVYARKRVAQL